MSNDTEQADSTVKGSPLPRKRRFQVNLLTILLLVLVCAVWIAYRGARVESQAMETQLASLRLIARELVIENPAEFAVVSRLPKFYNEKIWDVYVPKAHGKVARLAVAMDLIAAVHSKKIGDEKPLKWIKLKPGKHSIQLIYDVDDTAHLTVLVDEEVAIEIVRPQDWVKSGSSSSKGGIALSKSFPVDNGLLLHRRRFDIRRPRGTPSAHKELGPGIMLWIEMQDLETD